MLRQGAVVTSRFVDALADQGIHGVWVEDELSEGIEPAELMSEAVRWQMATRVHGALRHAQRAFADGQPKPTAFLY